MNGNKIEGALKEFCVLCGDEIEDLLHAHNAAPVDDGRCCDACNEMIVIPMRIAQARESEKEE